MLKYLLAGIALAFGLTVAVAATTTPTPRADYTKFIVEVGQVSNKNEFKGFCTGFYIGPGRVVTAGHCVNGDVDTGLWIKFPGQKPQKAMVSIYSSPYLSQKDYAVLSIGKTQFTPEEGLQLNCGDKTPELFSEVWMAGYPKEIGLVAVKGFVSGMGFSTWAPWTFPLLKMDLPSAGGFSGSPVFDVNNTVVGILVGSEPDNRVLSVAQPIDIVCKALDLG